MRLFLCLFCLAAAGIFLIVAPAEWVKLSHLRGPGGLFYQSLSAFSIPFTLLLLKFFRMPFVTSLSLAWAAWLTVLELWLLWHAAEALSGSGSYGLIFVSFVFCISLATLLVAAKARKSKRQVMANA